VVVHDLDLERIAFAPEIEYRDKLQQ